MRFKGLNLKSVYQSNSSDIIGDLYLNCLQSSVLYRRAVGYFSTHVLAMASKGIGCLVENGGHVQYLIGAELEQTETEAILMGYGEREAVLRGYSTKLSEALESVEEGLVRRRLETIAWMISNNCLDIKFVVRPRGMFHEKTGLFLEKNGDYIAFTGSSNETVYGLSPDYNSEVIHLYRSWDPGQLIYAADSKKRLETLWNNEVDSDTLVFDFPEVVRDSLLSNFLTTEKPSMETELRDWSELRKIYSRPKRVIGPTTEPAPPATVRDQPFKLKQHQEPAIENWIRQQGRGVIAFCTGGGKTITALSAIVELRKRLLEKSAEKLFVVIAVPYISLANQWINECAQFGFQPLRCFENSEKWIEASEHLMNHMQGAGKRFGSIVVVNQTLGREPFQNLLKIIPKHSLLLFIGDECHRHNSDNSSTSLPKDAHFRLGLSATPYSQYEDEEEQGVFKYYGDTVGEYGIADAIKDGVLTKYNYNFLFCPLSSTEAEEYEHLSDRISRALAVNSSGDHEAAGALTTLLMKRSRILQGVASKAEVLKSAIQSGFIPKMKHSLYYCAEGMIESGNDERHIDAIAAILEECGIRTSVFDSRTKKRDSVLEGFKKGHFDALVAMKCLDEGIDIPACSQAIILASSRNRRQFIQRRGRVLRLAPGKEHAGIFDFVPYIPTKLRTNPKHADKLLRAELERMREFMISADNFSDVLHELNKDLVDLGYSHL